MEEILSPRMRLELEALVESSVRKVLNEDRSQNNLHSSVSDTWFTIDDLCAYLPGTRKKTTIYRKVSRNEIPYKKEGRRLMFLKSDIDTWLKSKGPKMSSEIKAEANTYLHIKADKSPKIKALK